MSVVVMKFGGTSVADADKLRNVARRVSEKYKQGHRVVVVVSAQGKFTDELIDRVGEVCVAPPKREYDVLVSAGEQISMALLAMTLDSMHVPAVSLTGWQAGIKTDRNYASARILEIDCERLNYELDKKSVVIVAGFQGKNKYDDITTLGRGGSDTSAVALAAALKADLCEIYTDVDGVYTTDPRIVPNAKKLNSISYDEMLELSSAGANVLNNRSVELALKYKIPLCVRSSLTNDEGTMVKEVSQVEKMIVRGVARDNNVARISLVNIEDQPGKAFELFSLLAKNSICVDIILQSVGREGTKDITFTVESDRLDDTLKIINENLSLIGAAKIEYSNEVSKVSIVGSGMVSGMGVAAKMFEALYEAGINIQMISTSEIKISVLIHENDAEKAVIVIHDKFDPTL